MTPTQEGTGAVRAVRAGKDRPIIFSAPMVRALLDGRKTQTRRVLKPQPYPFECQGKPYWNASGCVGGRICVSDEHLLDLHRYRADDRLWVKEAHRFRGGRYNDGTEKEPDWSDDEWFRVSAPHDPSDSWDPNFPRGWRPSPAAGVHDLEGPEHDEGPEVVGMATLPRSPIFMPRWASRLTLIVEAVKVERLQDISEEDAVAEGIKPFRDRGLYTSPAHSDGKWRAGDNACLMYRDLWNDIHGPDAWDANPWICALTFRAIPQNIDSFRVTPTPDGPTGAASASLSTEQSR